MRFQSAFSFLLVFLCSWVLNKGFGQGCSDAGFCTMGALKPDQPYNKEVNLKIRSMELSQYFGVTRFGDYVHATGVDLNFSMGANSSMQFKLPYMMTQGPLGEVGGLGDVSLGFSRFMGELRDFNMNLSIGAKLPVSDANKTVDGRSFPMYYQQSLGTYDFVMGIGLVSKDWLITCGAQIPVYSNNKNGFFWGPWITAGFDPDIIALYPASINLSRKADFMMRVERNYRLGKWNFYYGWLNIMRFGEDERTHPKSGERVSVSGSEGLASTLLAGGGYNFTVKSGLKLTIGRRLFKRHFNPDGLSREWVINLGYQYKF
jgi:hypothetical protein